MPWKHLAKHINCYLSFAGHTTSVWIVGSSIIKNAFIKAQERPGGVSLDLQRLGVSIRWQGQSGLNMSNIRQQMNVMMRLEDPPDFIIIQVWGNDSGNVRIGHLQLQLKQFITWVSELHTQA
jgi:hypothetical protein